MSSTVTTSIVTASAVAAPIIARVPSAIGVAMMMRVGVSRGRILDIGAAIGPIIPGVAD